MKTKKHSAPPPSGFLDLCDELPFWSSPFGLKLLDTIDYRSTAAALDIGFGSGFPLIELAMRLGERCTVYGIDPWKDIIPQVESKIACFGINNIKLLSGFAESIPLPDRSVDLITSNNGINNVQDVELVFAECSRIIKPGGQFVWSMNTAKTMFEFYLQLETVLTEMGLNAALEAMHRHIDEKRPSVDSLVVLLQKQGFIIKNIEPDQFTYRFADGTAMLGHYFIRIAFLESWKKLLPPDREDEVLASVESKLNEFSRLCGGMKLSIPFVVVNAVKTEA